MLDPDGYIVEGSGDNFFIVKNNTVISPEGRNMLRGISRDYILNDLCKALKIKAIEKNIEPYDVYEADEAFICATPFCMLPVTSLNSLKIGDGKPGKIFNALIELWSKNNGVNIIKQIQSWNYDSENSKDKVTPYKVQMTKLDKIVDTLKTDNFVVIKNFFDKDLLSKIKKQK